MGWGSAAHMFDRMVKSTKEVLDEYYNPVFADPEISQDQMLVKIIEPLARELEDGDWDTQRDSDYFEELKWDVFPEIAKEIEGEQHDH